MDAYKYCTNGFLWQNQHKYICPDDKIMIYDLGTSYINAKCCHFNVDVRIIKISPTDEYITLGVLNILLSLERYKNCSNPTKSVRK